jgi:hypothetical protein
MAVNPKFWIQVVRTQAHVTDCREKTLALTNAANALETVIAERDASRSELQESALKVALIASKRESDLTTLRAENARMREALVELARYFTSRNDVPVERATIHAKDFWRVTGMQPATEALKEPTT